jgi:proline iminopeptidase
MGTHTIDANGLPQRYHVHGTGPVCVVHSGGPGVSWNYLRMPAVEQYLTMVYIEPSGTGDSGRLPTHPNGYTRQFYTAAIDRLLDHLGQEKVYLLGHSHGGFVVQRYAVDHGARLAGLVLYESAPVTGPEHGAEAATQVGQFAERNAGNPELPSVLASLQSVSMLRDDDQLTAALRGLLPSYFADYWGRADEFAPLRAEIKVNYISGLDSDGTPEVIDDRAVLPRIAVPTLVTAGRYDVICGVRWARELHDLIPGSRLVILENSGHMGHIEEPQNFADEVRDFIGAAATKG